MNDDKKSALSILERNKENYEQNRSDNRSLMNNVLGNTILFFLADSEDQEWENLLDFLQKWRNQYEGHRNDAKQPRKD